ncbi:unnamed protein product [Durusdinium trenchii]|uniref:Calcineurin-like phosphoesterase domain-containing protein n=1 Tax=Durusdinium trenchii TaxID=1381693 RepID=A0ABP0RBM8_9DINO
MAVLIDGLWRFVLRPLGRARLRCLWCWRRFCGSQDQVLHVFVSSSGLEKCHWKWLKRPPPPQEGCVRCVCISDTHLQHEDLHLPYGEILLHCGDVLLESRGLQASALEALRSFHRWIEQQPHQHKLLVAGNHDGVLQALGPERVQEVLPKCTYLQDQGIDLEGLKLYASPLSMGQSPNAAFQSHGGYDERAACEAIPEGLDLLITHGPAGQGALGRASAALAERICRVKPRVHVFGHYHLGHGISLQEVIEVNASSADALFAVTHPPIILDIQPRRRAQKEPKC